MPNTIANKWYETFAKEHIKEELGIDLIRTKDMNRLLIPNENGNGMRPLFEDGFQGTDEQKERLFTYARLGELFAISKKTDEAYQIGADRIQAVEDIVEQENNKVSTGKRVAYRATKLATSPVGFGFRVGRNLISMLTLGLLDTPLNWVYDGLSNGFNLLMEGVFSVSQMKAEDAQKLTLGDRFVHSLSGGKARAEKVKEIETRERLAQSCVRFRGHLDDSIRELLFQNYMDENQRNMDPEQAARDRALRETEEQLQAVRNSTHPQAENHDPEVQQNPAEQPNPEVQQEQEVQQNQVEQPDPQAENEADVEQQLQELEEELAHEVDQEMNAEEEEIRNDEVEPENRVPEERPIPEMENQNQEEEPVNEEAAEEIQEEIIEEVAEENAEEVEAEQVNQEVQQEQEEVFE